MVGLLGAIAAGVMLARRLSQGQEWNLALTGMALLGLLCAVFVVLCVNSFIAARRARKQREGS
jgi:predicted MFS family arabinose efflux permease